MRKGASGYLLEALEASGLLSGGGPQLDIVVQAAGGHAGQVGVGLQTVHLQSQGILLKAVFQGTFSQLICAICLLVNKDLNCYPLYLMLLGITKGNVIRKSRYYFNRLLLILIPPRMHDVTLGRQHGQGD